eukprot:gene4947-8543_t
MQVDDFEKILDELISELKKNISLNYNSNDSEFNKALKQSEEIHKKIFQKNRQINSEKVFLKILYQKYDNLEKKIEIYFSTRPISKGQEKYFRKKIKEFQQTKKVNESPNPLKFSDLRKATFTELIKQQNFEVYPHAFKPNYDIKSFINKFSNIENNSRIEEESISLTGRITFKRNTRANSFITIQSNELSLQVLGNPNEYSNPEEFEKINKLLKRGDIVGVIGHPGKSVRGELSIVPTKMILLAPCMKMISDNSMNLPYLELINNPTCRKNYLFKSKLNKLLRLFFVELDFLEVETPYLIPKFNLVSEFECAFDDEMKLYLRTSSLDYFEHLLIGGYDSIFEIGKSFQSDIDKPEYSICEFGCSNRSSQRCLNMFLDIFQNICELGDFKFNTVEIDVIQTLEEVLGLKFDNFDEKMKLKLEGILRKFEIGCAPPITIENILNGIIDEFIISKEYKNDDLVILKNFPNVYSNIEQSDKNKNSCCKIEVYIQNEIIFKGHSTKIPEKEIFEKQFGLISMSFGRIYTDNICQGFTDWNGILFPLPIDPNRKCLEDEIMEICDKILSFH